ncbi:MAG TPA: sialate O-acetylesterase [Chitinophagaceae bacterium]|nr:sialate O-acetylesterase [Chitinophagaceae bacterium]HAN39858.1 sialate O-acetylesterase [Chitinophagaceae bacterium]
MKKYYCCIVSIVACLTANAQTFDSSYNSTYYEQKVTLFRQLPDTKNEIIFLGNSITDIGEWAEIWQNPKVKNRGISGDNTFGILARLDEVVSSQPSKLFIMIGINDIARNIPDSIIIRNYERIIAKVQQASPRTRIIVQSILPTNNKFTQFKNHQNKTEHILTVNAALQNICRKANLTFVNLYPQFVDADGKLDERYSNDGLHLNGYGYMLWKDILLASGLM